MVGQLTPRQFHASPGVEDWRVLLTGACTYFRTGSFARGVLLVESIGRLADAANHHPDVDLRYRGVAVRVWSHDVDGLSERDVALARSISAAARDLGVEADPSAVQDVQIAVGAADVGALATFWGAMLGYRRSSGADVVDVAGRGPAVSFQRTEEPPPRRTRIHVGVVVPREVATARVAAALDAGGVLVSDAHAPARWTLADPEGNEVHVATVTGPG